MRAARVMSTARTPACGSGEAPSQLTASSGFTRSWARGGLAGGGFGWARCCLTASVRVFAGRTAGMVGSGACFYLTGPNREVDVSRAIAGESPSLLPSPVGTVEKGKPVARPGRKAMGLRLRRSPGCRRVLMAITHGPDRVFFSCQPCWSQPNSGGSDDGT